MVCTVYHRHWYTFFFILPTPSAIRYTMTIPWGNRWSSWPVGSCLILFEPGWSCLIGWSWMIMDDVFTCIYHPVIDKWLVLPLNTIVKMRECFFGFVDPKPRPLLKWVVGSSVTLCGCAKRQPLTAEWTDVLNSCCQQLVWPITGSMACSHWLLRYYTCDIRNSIAHW